MKARILILIAVTVALVPLAAIFPATGPVTLAAPSSADWSAIYLPAVIAPPPIYFADDFESGVSKWTPFVNYWRLSPSQWFWDCGQGYGGSQA